ncbi:PAS domain S-box protein [Methylobacterium radiodurans]|uniref:PAS domain S-box protein n=1 Tax=Methylobacterium radiodurans TaxID=2202828 RepID=UPI0013A574A1|nr:PAS domain-containing protein [Methylobacterium radiodurans]
MTDATNSSPLDRTRTPGHHVDPALFGVAVEAAGEAILITTPDLQDPGPVIVYVNPGFTRMTGYTREEAVGRSPRFLQGPETDRAVLDRLRAELAAGRPFHGETVNYRKDGSTYLIDWLITPMRDRAGEITHWIAIQRDITQLRQNEAQLRNAAEQRGLMLGELQHRVRSTLAAVRGLARRTGDTSLTAEDYAAHLDGRLNALTRVLGVIGQDPGAGISLESLVAEELLTNIAHEGEQAFISGPEVLLQPRAAETFGLALHELATNAVKYGALTSAQGRVTVRWWIEGEERQGADRLIFDWVETGAQHPVLAPQPGGFGMSLLQDTLPYELEAETTIAFTPQGLACRIALPVTPRVLRSVEDARSEPLRRC